MQSTLSNQQIYSYLQSLHFKIHSQSSLREMDSLFLWSTLTTLARRVQLCSVTNTIALLCHQIEEPQRHTRSLEWVSCKLLLSTLYRALGLQFKIMHYFRPERDKMHGILSRVVSVCMWGDRLRQENDGLFVRSSSVGRELMRMRNELEDAMGVYGEMERRKREEEPLYRQYAAEIHQCREEIAQERARGLEGEKGIKDWEEEEERMDRVNEGNKYKICEKEIETVRLSKEIASNAPQIKKEKILLEEEYSNLEEEYTSMKRVAEQKKHCFYSSLAARQRHYPKIDNYKHLLQTLAYIEQEETKESHLTQATQHLKEEVSVSNVEESDCQDKLKKEITEQMHLFNQTQNAGSKMNDVESGLEKITFQIIKTSERIAKLKEYQLELNKKNKELENRMQSVLDSSLQQLQQIERQLREKSSMVHNSIQEMRRDLII